MLIDPQTSEARHVSSLFKSLVVPRPIGWISTIDAEGRANLAPYSFFNAIDDAPPLVMFSSNGFKDSAANAVSSREFVVNIVTERLAEAMNATAAPLPAGTSEFEHAGIASLPSTHVAPPRVRDAAASLECKVVSIQQISDMNGTPLETYMIIGQVVAIHVADHLLGTNGRVDLLKDVPIGRLGGPNYVAVREAFALARPVR